MKISYEVLQKVIKSSEIKVQSVLDTDFQSRRREVEILQDAVSAAYYCWLLTELSIGDYGTEQTYLEVPFEEYAARDLSLHGFGHVKNYDQLDENLAQLMLLKNDPDLRVDLRDLVVKGHELLGDLVIALRNRGMFDEPEGLDMINGALRVAGDKMLSRLMVKDVIDYSDTVLLDTRQHKTTIWPHENLDIVE